MFISVLSEKYLCSSIYTQFQTALNCMVVLLVRCQGLHFSVVVTEGRPDDTGIRMAKSLDDMGCPVTLVLDSGVAHVMERCGPA